MNTKVPEFITIGATVLYKGKPVKVIDSLLSCPCVLGKKDNHTADDLNVPVVNLEGIGTVPYLIEDFNSLNLKYAEIAKDVWQALNEIPREGWVRRKVKNPETVQEHSISSRNLVIDMIDLLPEFSTKDILDILDILEVHDYPEKIDGDKVIVTYDKEEKKRLEEEKFISEFNAMSEICNGLGLDGKDIFKLWLRFEEKIDAMSIFAKQIDKYQSIEKAFEYQQKGEKVRAQDFIDYYRNDIVHPVLKQRISYIEKKI
ncbi:MAG: HD domain-containing protein [Minisyncoccia bacterium]